MTRGHFFATFLTALFGARSAHWFADEDVAYSNLEDAAESASNYIWVTDEMLEDSAVDIESFIGEYLDLKRGDVYSVTRGDQVQLKEVMECLS